MADDQPGHWDDVDLPPECSAWVKEVDQIMARDWCLDLSDAGADSEQVLRYWKFEQTPADFVEWFAEKYDLIRLERRDRGRPRWSPSIS